MVLSSVTAILMDDEFGLVADMFATSVRVSDVALLCVCVCERDVKAIAVTGKRSL
jgi:hypothetical protein